MGMVTKFTSSIFSPPSTACWPNQNIFWKERSVSTLFWTTLMKSLILVMFFTWSICSTMACRKACWVLMRPRSPSGYPFMTPLTLLSWR